MSARAGLTALAGAVLGVILTFPGAATAVAAGEEPERPDDVSGPRVQVEPAAARPGEVVLVQLTGWKSVAATVTVCGNLARRGSADCDVRAGQGVPLAVTGGVASARLVVTEPPAPCPCVVRAASGSHDEVATAPLEVIGVPVAPVVEPADPGPLLSVTIEPRRAPEGVLDTVRAALGGPVAYEVEVSVRNRTAAPLAAIRVGGRARTRFSDTAGTFTVDAGPLGPGETWRHRARVEMPALALGTLHWEAVASGAGEPIRAERATRNVPVALLAVAALLVGDVAAIGGRLAAKRARARAEPDGSSGGDADLDPDPAGPPGIPAHRDVLDGIVMAGSGPA